MKHLPKSLLIILFVFSSLFFQFCNDKCGAKSVQQRLIETYTYRQVFKFEGKNQKNYLNDSIPMSSDDTVYITLRPEIRFATNDRGISDALFACDPVIPETIALGDSMRIIAVNSFDTMHPAGSDVTDLFRLFLPEYDNTGNMMRGEYFPLNQFQRFKTTESASFLALIKQPAFKDINFRMLVYRQSIANAAVIDLPLMSFYK